ncbi:medium-chain fatty acid-CoA ligase faa2 [Thecaphora frezii]|nr:putative long-chain acyl-CoA synthetase [Thecaphora frezii]
MENFPTPPKSWPLDKQTLPVPGTQEPGYSAIYRNAAVPVLKTSGTMYDLFNLGKAANPKADCAGWRPWNKDNKNFEPFFEWISYDDVEEQRTAIGSALTHLARQGKFGDGIGDRDWSVGLWVLNRPEYLIVDQANLAYSRRLVSLYDSYDTPSASYILNHAEVRVLFTTPSHVAAVLSEKGAGNLPLLKAIVILEPFRLPKVECDAPPSDPAKDLLAKQWAATVGVDTYAWHELLQLGRQNVLAHTPPTFNDIVSFCYTSGTTGNPKAAIITGGMGYAAAASLMLHIYEPYTLLSYLPTAHIYARGTEQFVLRVGGRIGYFCGDTTRLVEDAQILQPTMFTSVPRVLNRIAGLIEAQARAPGLKGKLLRTAIETKVANHDRDGTLTHPIYDRLVFNKVKKVLGGNIRVIVSGSAPIRPEVLKLLRIAFICDVREGYGQTENYGTCLLMNPNDTSLGSCGPCLPGIEFRLRDIPELGYTSADKPFPRGELLSRSPMTFPGYYKDEKKTAETIDEQGWLHSGDIALLDEHNRIKIIDRVKSLVKLSQGEYIAIDSLSEFYGRCSLSAQILVHGDSFRDYLVAVVVPEPALFAPFASKVLNRPISETDVQALAQAAQDEKVQAAYLDEYTKIAKQHKLKGFEYIKGLHISTTPMTVENGLLTPTLKVKRHQAAAYFKDDIEKVYQKGPAVKPKL